MKYIYKIISVVVVVGAVECVNKSKKPHNNREKPKG